jgi:glutamate 5-kinase
MEEGAVQDTINVEELRIGDNDTLSAQVAVLVQADWLFLMTDVDFLYTANPSLDPTAQPIMVRHQEAVATSPFAAPVVSSVY